MSDAPDNDAMEAAIAAWVTHATGLAVGQVIWSAGQPRPAGTYVQLSIPTDDTIDNGEDTSVWNWLVLPDQTITAVVGNVLTIVGHPYQNADGPVRMPSTGTTPGGITTTTDVWLIVDDADHVRLASTYINARHNTPIALTGSGTGTLKLVTQAERSLRTGQETLKRVLSLSKLTLRATCFSRVATGEGTARSILRKLIRRGSLPAAARLLTDAGLGLSRNTSIQTLDGLAGANPGQMIFEPRAIMSVDMYYRSNVSEYGTIIASADITNHRTGRTFHVPKD